MPRVKQSTLVGQQPLCLDTVLLDCVSLDLVVLKTSQETRLAYMYS